jgi:RNA polymerase sigma factor (sigma-70 family)
MDVDDDELLHRARTDPEAFGLFYRRHVEWVLAFLARRVPDQDAVADLAAESFAQALVALPRYDPSRGTPNAWLFGIVTNQLHAYWRRGAVNTRVQRRLGMERQGLEEDDRAALERLGGEAVAVELLAELPDDQREAIRGQVLEGRSYEQLATETGVPEATVRKRVSRGLALLRGRLPGVADD